MNSYFKIDLSNEEIFEPAEIPTENEREYFNSIKTYPVTTLPGRISLNKILNIAEGDNIPQLQLFCYSIKKCPFSQWLPIFFSMVERRQFIISAGTQKILELCDKIYNMDEDCFRILLTAPPRIGKTTIMLYFMLYAVINDPKDTKFIFISYTSERIKGVSAEFKRLLDNNVYRIGYRHSPYMEDDLSSKITYYYEKEYSLKKKNKDTVSNAKVLFASGAEIQFYSANGSITGNGAGKMYQKNNENEEELKIKKHFTGGVIYDDPNKPDGSESDTISEKINDNFDAVIPSRLNDGKETLLMIMQQRIKVNDLTGHILKKMEGNFIKYNYIQLPMINKYNYCLFDFTPVDIYQRYLEFGRKHFLAQCQQMPTSSETRLINVNLFKFYKEDFYDLPCEKWFITTDYSFDGDDQTCLMFWGLHYNIEKGRIDLYLVDMLYKRCEDGGIIKLTSDFFMKWNRKRTRKFANILINCIIIEKNRNEPILSEIKKYDLPIKEVMRSKISTKLIRAQSFIQYFGRTVEIFLPENALYFPNEHIQSLLICCKNFKGGKKDKDDIVDNILDAGKFAADEYSHVNINQ